MATHDLAGLIAKMFIARPDVKAAQNAKGDYMPVQHCTECGRGYCDHETPKIREGWKRADIEAHLAGEKTYGHYLLNPSDICKLFAFDIDLEKTGSFPNPVDAFNDKGDYTGTIEEFNPREAWLDRRHPSRVWLKYQLKATAMRLMRSIHNELGLPTACTYTGAKGLHVYGFTGPIDAADARSGAQIVIDSVGGLYPTRGENFYMFNNLDPIEGQPNIKIEVFPKQDSLDGKDLGNLMRLPLGRNLKNPKDPTFFVNMATALNDISPVDPIFALTTPHFAAMPGE